MKRIVLFLLTMVVFCGLALAQGVTGKWKTFDPETDEPSSIVELFIEDGKLYGKIIKVLNAENGENLKCEDCPEPWKNKPIVGLQFINGMEKKGNKWSGKKTLFSRKKKKTYDGAIWLKNEDVLKLRIYVGFIHVTKEWQRVK
ncbi:DUF2147 domain-containing protein [Prolixibacteraceae bacterium JC049]|nr:DUF2147 domain-containing protein [Prolixibacteraceae bacterium JC049]